MNTVQHILGGVFAAGLVACASGLGPAPGAPDRLPGELRPTHVDLELEVLPDQERFRGEAAIQIELQRAQQRLWIHGRRLRVSDVFLERPDGTRVAATWHDVDADAGVARLALAQSVGPGPATLHLRWDAAFDPHLRGLYRVRVAGDDYVFSQLEPVAARRIFPGFDEPRWKPTWSVALVVPADHVAISNAPQIDEEPLDAGRRRVRFARTPPLPSYLLAFAVGPLAQRDAPPIGAAGPRDRALPLRGFASRERGDDLEFALRHTPPLLRWLEAWFDRPHPYAKLDLIAVPQFAAGAMENAGAITFREYLLLLEEDRASEAQRRSFVAVMAHELAHQWFGNLVTMPWWDDLWLNEAFASWLGARAHAELWPEHQPALRELAAVHHAMNSDALAAARRVRQPVQDIHDIRNAFDGITYSKGAGVIGMFERWLGAAPFRNAVVRHVAAHAHGNADAADLLRALGDETGRDVATPFRSFLDQPGVPRVDSRLRCDATGAQLQLRQQRHLPVGSRASRDGLWQIPVCARWAAGSATGENCTLMRSREATLRLDAPTCPDWVLPNAAAAGYYRWSVPAGEAEALIAAGDALSPAERLSLASSLDAARVAGIRPASEIHALLEPLAADPSRVVATAPMRALRDALHHLVPEPARAHVARRARALYAPHLARLGWEGRAGEGGETRLLRRDVVAFLANDARDPELRRVLARLGRRHSGVDGGTYLDPQAADSELLGVALRVAVEDGGAPVFEHLVARIEHTYTADARARVLRALGATRDPVLAARARALSFDPRLASHEALTPLWAQSGDATTREPTWRFVEERFDALVERVGPASAAALPWLAAGFCSEPRARRVEAFLAPRIAGLEGGPRQLAAVLERIRLCAARVEAQGPDTQRFFEAAAGGG